MVNLQSSNPESFFTLWLGENWVSWWPFHWRARQMRGSECAHFVGFKLLVDSSTPCQGRMTTPYRTTNENCRNTIRREYLHARYLLVPVKSACMKRGKLSWNIHYWRKSQSVCLESQSSCENVSLISREHSSRHKPSERTLVLKKF
jgi:hypothetical protein